MKVVRTISKVLLVGALALVGIGSLKGQAAQVKTSHALANYNVKAVKLIKNKDYFVTRPDTYATSPTYRSQGTFQTTPDIYQSVKGHPALLRTALYLPVTVHHSGDWSDPQAVVVTPNGKTVYIAYLKASNTTTGWIVRYDLAKLVQALGGYTSRMDALRRATNAYSKHKATSRDRSLLKYIKEGPTFDIGHGQSLAYNPKDKQLWFTRSNGKAGQYGSAVKVSSKTLRPTKQVAYRLVNKQGAKLAVNSTLAFDRQGYAYFSSYSGQRSLRVYRGTMNDHGVHFKLMMQGLAYRPGQTHQSIAYNPHNDRLYFVSDDAISSVPVKKLRQRQATLKDVHASVFASQREFEGLSFTAAGQGYLILNRGAELMRIDIS